LLHCVAAAQVIPEMSEHDANTNEVLFSKHNINHEEGGWPKDVDYAEAEHTIRFRKKACRCRLAHSGMHSTCLLRSYPCRSSERNPTPSSC
jgi:hypothetical protein